MLFTRKKKRRQPAVLISPRLAAKSVILNGEVGSGKTTILKQLLEQLATANERVHFACTAVKPTDADDYEEVLRRAGRDPLRIKPDGKVRISPFQHEMSRVGGGSRNLAVLHEDLIEVLSRSDSSKGETYWKSLTADTTRHAFELAHMVAGKQASYSDVEAIIMSTPKTLEEAASKEYAQQAVCGQFLVKAYELDPNRAKVIADHFLQRIPAIGSKGRGAALMGSIQGIQPFTTPPISNVVGGTPTHTVQELLERDTIWDMDTNTYGKSGLAMQLILSWLCMEEVLRRQGDFDYFALVRDEYGHTCHPDRDIKTQSVGRSQKFIGLSCIQSVSILESQLGGSIEASTDAKAVYGLHVNKIMCRQSDSFDAELNAKIIGQERKMFYSGGTQQNQQQQPQWWDVLGVGERPSFGFQQNYHFRCPPLVFQTLKAGGEEYGYEVQAIVYDGSQNFFRHSFFQR